MEQDADTIDGRTAREGLPLTPAMRRFAEQIGRSWLTGFALFAGLGLFGFPTVLILMLGQGSKTIELVWVGVIAIVWTLLSLGFWSKVAASRRAARIGTYARFVGPFRVYRSDNSEGIQYYELDFADENFTLGRAGDDAVSQIAALEGHRSGVIDWLPGVHQILAVWNDRGHEIFRAPGYDFDHDVVPPRAVRRPARPTPAAITRRQKKAARR